MLFAQVGRRRRGWWGRSQKVAQGIAVNVVKAFVGEMPSVPVVSLAGQIKLNLSSEPRNC